jgi:hypothetical protein
MLFRLRHFPNGYEQAPTDAIGGQRIGRKRPYSLPGASSHSPVNINWNVAGNASRYGMPLSNVPTIGQREVAASAVRRLTIVGATGVLLLSSKQMKIGEPKWTRRQRYLRQTVLSEQG